MLSSDTLGSFRAHLRRFLDRLVDRGVAGAAAEVAADRLGDLVARWPRVRVEKRLRRQQDPRRAIAALRRALFGERGLQGVKLWPLREPFHGRDVRMRDLLRQGEAGEDRHAVGEDRACATLAELAAVLRTGEIQLRAQHLEERVLRLRGEG